MRGDVLALVEFVVGLLEILGHVGHPALNRPVGDVRKRFVLADGAGVREHDQALASFARDRAGAEVRF